MITESSTAFQNEPDGFRGIKWGTNISTLKDMRRKGENKDKSSNYTKKKDDYKLGDVKVDGILYGFFDNEFSDVTIFFSGESIFYELKQVCISRWGNGKHQILSPVDFEWKGNICVIWLAYDIFRSDGMLIIMSKLHKDKKEEYNKGKIKKDSLKGF